MWLIDKTTPIVVISFPGDLVEQVSQFAELLGWKEELEKLIQTSEGEYQVWLQT